MNTRLVVIGGVAAGMSAAARAKRHNPSLEVSVFERSGYVSYSACGLPFYISGVVKDVTGLIARTPERFAADGIHVHLKHEAIAIDPGAGTVAVRDLATGTLRDVAYDRLILASGAQATRPNVPGAHLAGVFTLRTVEDADAIKAWLAVQKPRTAVIVGAGYVGIELAESICAHGVDVTVIEAQDQVMPSLDADLAAKVQQTLEDMGIHIQLGARLTSFVGAGLVGDVVARVLGRMSGEAPRMSGDLLRVREVVTSTGSLPADIVILGGGARPAAELARAAGIALGATGAVAVDAEQRTNLPEIWAAGAVGETYHRLLKKPIYFPLARAATLQGRVAGVNAASRREAAGSARFPGTLGTSVVKAFGLTIALTGLTERQAKAAGFDAANVTVTSTSRAGFMPGSERIQTRLVFENGSGRLLGAQMVGGDEVAKRLDVVAAALQAGWTAEDLAEADLTYTPPVAPLWDGSLSAATLAARQIQR
ncbi:MAG: FAD-dependent oxidoreductase [Anaerolineales bacterium]|nr:FAD-dependent oxidoreductase [Anaerolineales bacterium]